MTAIDEGYQGEEAAAGIGGAAPDGLHNASLYAALALTLFSLPVCAADLGGLNNDYTPPQFPAKPKPRVAERIVDKTARAEAPSAPMPASDPAAACWKIDTWEAACGFAAYPGGPIFRVVGGNLNFTQGSPSAETGGFDNERPQHAVRFQQRFALAETEITVAHYLTCVKEGGCGEPVWHDVNYGSSHYRDRNAHQPTSPITGVSWTDAKAYVAWLSRKTGQTYTLPTEAQWEYAARGGHAGRWYFGDDEGRLKDRVWYGANSDSKLHPVGSTLFNTHPWGLKDMGGNAWEWVEDCEHSYT